MLRNEGLKRVRMRLITAVIFVFTLTCSGSFGMEDVVSSSGPGMTLLMILILPLVWSVPMAFVASELGSMVPEAGGLYRWIRRGMGEYWSFQAGWWWTLSLYVDSAVYVALALDYMQNQWGFGATERALIGIGIVAVFTFINIRGLELTGWSLTIIQIGVMVPLLIFTAYGIIKGTGSGFSPVLPEGESFLTSLNLGLAIMMWMYSGWESMSTLAGEIENPQRVIPKALMIGTPLVIATYFVTVWASIRIANLGGPDNYLNMWTGGGGEDFVQLAEVVGGAFFGYLMLMSAILSNIGLYAGYLATGARPQFQMSRDRLLPRFLGRTHASWGTPWVAILLMGVGQRGADQLQLRRAHHHRRLPAHVPLRAHLPDGDDHARQGTGHPEVLPGPAPDLGARRVGSLPDRHRHHRPVRERHGLDDRRPRRHPHGADRLPRLQEHLQGQHG